MASVTTTEFLRSGSHAESPPFTLIEQPGLISRLAREINNALLELWRDPRAFVEGLVAADTRDAKRRQRIQIGLAGALVIHAALLAVIAILGWRTIFVKAVDDNEEFVILAPPSSLQRPEGEIPKGTKRGDGGGGGDDNPLPATKGPKPQMSQLPQVVKPNTLTAVLPTIQLPPTIVGPDSPAPPPGVPLGISTGVIADAPSPGPGTGEGLGGVRGSGAGPGSGPGSGPGDTGAGVGGKNRSGLTTGREDATGPIPYNLIDRYPERTGIVWLYRPRPIVTPEAEANKVMGEVLLRATFREDGTITDIEIIREVPFMTESAIDALLHSKFRPATIKGRPVTLTRVPVRINVDVVAR
jgi:hypothetical protein